MIGYLLEGNSESDLTENIINEQSDEKENMSVLMEEKETKICNNIENEVWIKRCAAYEEKNPEYCESFDVGSSSSKEKMDQCYYDLSIYAKTNYCSEISDDKKRWKCQAIADKDKDKCLYSPDLKSEIWCLREYSRFYMDSSACDLIGQKEEEIIKAGFIDSAGNIETGLSEDDCLNSLRTIKKAVERTFEETIIAVYGSMCNLEYNSDCSSYEDENKKSDCLFCQAMQTKDSNKCFLIKNNRRDPCIMALALLTKDVSLCNERSDEPHKSSCINQYGTSIDVNVCLDPLNYDCIINAVSEMHESYQKIDYRICENILDKNTKERCYIEYVKAELYMQK